MDRPATHQHPSHLGLRQRAQRRARSAAQRQHAQRQWAIRAMAVDRRMSGCFIHVRCVGYDTGRVRRLRDHMGHERLGPPRAALHDDAV